jgi:hypothetical protein
MEINDVVESLRSAATQLEEAYPGIPDSADVAGTIGWYQGKRAGIEWAIGLIELAGQLKQLEVKDASGH